VAPAETPAAASFDRVGAVASSPPALGAERAAADPGHEGLYLIGRPTLKRFIRHVRQNAEHPPGEGALVEEWQAGRHAVRALEKAEAGVAEDAPIVKLGPAYEPALMNLLKDPLIRHGFNTLPSEVALVDLDRVVVYQKHIDLTYVAQLQREWPAAPSDEEVFRMCLPYDHPTPPVRWSATDGDKFVFISPSNDLRFLGTMPLDPDDIPDYPPPGSLVGVVGVAVGFGSNFLNAICAEKRLVLRNGSHRAFALYQRGIRRVPCIIQHVSSRDELDLVGSSELQRHPDVYLRSPRPPMLRDYFNPALRKVMKVRRRLRQVTVSFHVEEAMVPAL
jgi:hypothetical protein